MLVMTSWHSKTRSAQIRDLSLHRMMQRKYARLRANRKVWTVTKTDELNKDKAYAKTKEVSE